MTTMLNRRQFLMGAAALGGSLVLSGCGGGSSSSEADSDPSKREYIPDDQIEQFFTKPDDFKGKWVKLPGVVLKGSETDGDQTVVQAFYDVVKHEKSYMVYSKTTDSFASDDYILVEGKVDGTFTGKNYFGTDLTVPKIVDATITKSTYMDVAAPTVAQVEPAVSASEYGVTFSCDKVEYAKAETRVYMTVKNDSQNTINFGEYSIRLIVNGSQVEQDQASESRYLGKYPQLSYDVTAGASTSGILIFPPIEQNTSFQILIPDIYSDDFMQEFKDVQLNINF